MNWELATGRALATLEGHTSWLNACAVTPDGQAPRDGAQHA